MSTTSIKNNFKHDQSPPIYTNYFNANLSEKLYLREKREREKKKEKRDMNVRSGP